ncbi:hypothetical protein ACFS5M_03560 [Lacinutrix iliipiscaria]|uniref:Gliding motility protein GldL-like N-terminal domain-containing protein n=1 Tax=Lacinutrix iliipiscaria TaxID=1230532 RepID=A0ABW5WNH5_9FLAO
MKLQEKHIDFIENSLKLYGVKSEALREDLIDHICTFIETQDSEDFNTLYQEALQKFGGYSSFQDLQLETNLQKFAQEVILLSKLKFSASCIVLLLFVLSFIFKIMHWPYANTMMIAGLLVAVLVLVPIHFYAKYKSSVHKFS